MSAQLFDPSPRGGGGEYLSVFFFGGLSKEQKLKIHAKGKGNKENWCENPRLK